MSKSRLDDYLKQLESIEKKGYKVELKEDVYILSKDEIILFESKYLNELENFINANWFKRNRESNTIFL